MELKFEPESIKALQTMENTKKSLYLTGKAGAGKSTIVNYFISKTKKKFVLLGTTGISAINIGGQTIHSFFGLIPGQRRSMMKSETLRKILETDIFIIDEASMLRADLFDRLDKLLRKITGVDEFMGGKQFVFVGDLYQLPPVPEKDEEARKEYDRTYRGLFFFEGNSFKKENIEIVELRKVYRQDDPTFVSMLNRCRVGDKSQDLLEYFNKRVVSKNDLNPKSILIATTNAIVDAKNKLELDKLPGEELLSFAIIRGDFDPDEYPTDKVVKFKVGARVMMSANDKDGRFVNGSLGTVTNIEANGKFINYVYITLDEGGSIKVAKKNWDKIDGEDDMGEPNIIGTFIQFPFKLAFAITIHKVQGKSFDNVIIDLGRGAFAEGQTYVALSRCRTYQGIQLVKPINPSDIKASLGVMKFMEK